MARLHVDGVDRARPNHSHRIRFEVEEVGREGDSVGEDHRPSSGKELRVSQAVDGPLEKKLWFATRRGHTK